MSAKVGSLLIDIHANVAQLSKDMAKAQSTIDGALGKVASTVKAFGAAAVAAFAVDKVLSFADAAFDAAVGLDKAAQRTGASVEALAALQHAASVTGVEFDVVTEAMGTLSERAFDAASGTQGMIDMFQQLGVAFKDAEGNLLPTQDLLGNVADRFAQMEDGSAKLGQALILMGDDGAKMIPMLNKGREGLEAMRIEAEQLGVVISSDTAARAAELKQNMERLHGALGGVANGVMAKLLPSLLAVTDSLLEGAKAGSGFGNVLGTVLAGGFKIVASVANVAWTIFKNVIASIASISVAVVELVQGNFREANEALILGGQDIADQWKESGRTIYETWADVPAAVEVAADRVKEHAGRVVQPLGAVKNAAKDAGEAIAAALSKAAAIEASLTKSRVDDIAASYDAQIAELEKKIAKEKISEEEKAAYLRELDALRVARATEILKAQDEEYRTAQRRRVDVDLENAAMRAELTQGETDNIEATYAERLEMLRRKLEDENLTEGEFAEQKKLILAQKDLELTELHNAETLKRTEAQKRAYSTLASSFAGAFTDLVFAPLEAGFGSLEDLVGSLHRAVIALIKDILVAGIFKALTGAATGGFGGAVLTALGFAGGGHVRGPGTPTSDSIPAMLSDGEYVINAKSTRKLGVPMLNWLNSLGDSQRPAPGFSSGGAVHASRLSGSSSMGGGAVTIAPTFNVQAGGGLLHRELLVRELGPAMRAMAIEQMDGIIRQLGLSPAAVTARG